MRTERKFSHLGVREGVLKKRRQPRQECEEGAGRAEVCDDHSTVGCRGEWQEVKVGRYIVQVVNQGGRFIVTEKTRPLLKGFASDLDWTKS